MGQNEILRIVDPRLVVAEALGQVGEATLAEFVWPAGFGTAFFPALLLFLAGFGSERFAFDGPQILRGTVFGGFVLVVVGTAFSGLLAVLFNLIGDLTGGLRVTVIEVERTRPSGGRPTET